jgi:hypothetical protein
VLALVLAPAKGSLETDYHTVVSVGQAASYHTALDNDLLCYHHNAANAEGLLDEDNTLSQYSGLEYKGRGYQFLTASLDYSLGELGRVLAKVDSSWAAVPTHQERKVLKVRLDH